MTRYRVKSVFRTLQGEGSRAGSPAIFVRLSGCNLWSGRDHNRDAGQGECAAWCDTDFAGGDLLTADQLADRIAGEAAGMAAPLVVFSGGEPTLQLGHGDEDLLDHLHECVPNATFALESNGTGPAPVWIDHVTVSPKPLRSGPGLDHVVQRTGDDLKVVCPTPFTDDELRGLAAGFVNCYAQPMDVGGAVVESMRLREAIALAERLGWRVSVQTHKLVGLP